MTASNFTDIKQYLVSLTQPQQQLDGHAICPFIQKYFDDISYTQHGSEESVLALIPKVVAQKNVAHVMECVFEWDWFDMERTLQTLHHLYLRDDMEFLFMHPESEDAPLPLHNYRYQHPLIIAQRRSILREARKRLAKTTNYYEHWQAIDK